MSEILEPSTNVLRISVSELKSTEPGLLKTIKRNGNVVHYDEELYF